MSRPCTNPFTPRVKGKRAEFASTRTSLSESWDQSFCDDEVSRAPPGYPDLPSPTIGAKDIDMTQLDNSFSLLSEESKKKEMSTSGTNAARAEQPLILLPTIWKRHVAIQCNLTQPIQNIMQVSGSVFDRELKLAKHRHHPYIVPLGRGSVHRNSLSLLSTSKFLSKSLDWDEFPLSSHSQLWEPFCNILGQENEKELMSHISILTNNGLIYAPVSIIEEESLRCDNCAGLSPSKFTSQIDSLTTSIKGGGEKCRKKIELETRAEIQARPPRPALSFTLPIPQLTVTAQQGGESGANTQAGNSSGSLVRTHKCPSSSKSAKRSPSPAFHSASVDHGTSGVKVEHVEGRVKSSTLPTIDSKHIVAIRNAEKRRRFFARKQTNSAPDSFEASSIFNVTTHGVINTTRRLCGNCKEPVTNCLDGVLRVTRREKADPSIITPTVDIWESEIRTARCGDVAVTHVSELDFPDADPPCHFCCEQASTAIHDESRLQIVSGGLVRSRDGSARSGSGPYINLPSPNVQAENGGEGVAFGSIDLSPSMSQTLSPGSHQMGPCSRSSLSGSSGSAKGGEINSKSGGEEEDPLVGPPVSSLTRRPALVPPKIMSDTDYENEAERDKSSRSSDEGASQLTRRSSIVVIPPMQICPGDLLVYGKVLSQRKSLLGTTIESPSPVSMFDPGDNAPARKGKATWSLLKLFERSNRSKGGGVVTLEEIMSIIQPCDFSDPKLSRFKGMCWADFANYVTQSKNRASLAPSLTSPVDDDELLLPKITASIAASTYPKPCEKPCEKLIVNTTNIATGTASTSGNSPPTESLLQSLAKGPAPIPKKEASPKPLVRKRMGLMRTMSDRCLERRITPGLFRASPGFLGEKLVEGKEPETPTGPPSPLLPKINGTKEKAKTSPFSKVASVVSIKDKLVTSSSESPKPYPLISTKSEKDFFDNVKDCVPVRSSIGGEESITDPELRQKLRQKEALWDLFQSECSFLYDHLMVLKNVFLEPLKRIQVEGFAMYAEPELLFGTLDELCCVTYGFCKEFIYLLLKLTNTSGELSTMEVLGKLFEPSSKARAMSQAYHRYALNYINALNYLETLRRHAEFVEFEKFCMRDPRCKKLQLTDLLVSPVQHIMKVPLILKDIQSRTDEPKEKEIIAQILEIQENSIRELDDKMRWLKNFERLLEIQRNIVWPSILEMEPKTWVPEFLRVALARQPCDSLVVSPRRQIVHEGLLQLWDTGKPTEAYVILFDDMLLITRRKKGLSKKKSSLTENWGSSCSKSTGVVGSGLETNHRYIVYRQPISLDRFFIHDIGEAENATSKLDFAFVLVSLNRFQQIVSVHTFQATSDTLKSTWLQKMKTTQDKWKRTLQNTVFRGVRTSTDSGQSNVASALLGNISKSFLGRES